MTGPVQFLIAAALYHPAAPYLAAVWFLGLLMIATIPFNIRVHGFATRFVPRIRAGRSAVAPASRPAPTPARQLSQAAIDCVPLLDPARANLLERLEDVVECLGQAQRVLPDIALSRALCLRPGSGDGDISAAAQQALNRADLDFGVFSYGGQLELAVMIGTPAATTANPDRQLVEIALERAGIPLIQIPADAPLAQLRSRIQSVLLPMPDRARVA